MSKFIEKMKYVKRSIIERNELDSCSYNINALARDEGALTPNDRNHYKFDNIACNDFTDYVVTKIATALKKSKQATQITLFHGNMGDEGMNKFIEALSKTEAPIKAVHLDDLQYITDKSMNALPEIIKNKEIANVNMGYLPKVSEELKKEIRIACNNNKNVKTFAIPSTQRQ